MLACPVPKLALAVWCPGGLQEILKSMENWASNLKRQSLVLATYLTNLYLPSEERNEYSQLTI